MLKKTKIPFKPLNMDIETLMRHKDYAKSLTTNDILEINRLVDNEEYQEFTSILARMLKLNKKLEQEIIF